MTNAAGCGSTLKEYGEILEHDTEYAEKAARFSSQVRDVTEFLGAIELNRELAPLAVAVTYQDSCHLAHGQKIRTQPRKLLQSIPGLTFREMTQSDLCCGSAGIYNVVHTQTSLALLEQKMGAVNATRAEVIATENPGCMLQLQAGVRRHGHGQRVLHVVELLDDSYRSARMRGTGAS